MKKTLLLFAAALMSVAASADVTPTKSVTGIYRDYVYGGETYTNYTDADWKMKSDSTTFVVDFYGTDSLVIRNWMNQGKDLCVKYDPSTGDVIGVNNPGKEASYWAYASDTYYAYVSDQSYYNRSFVTKNQIYLMISWGTTWENYNIDFPKYSVEVAPFRSNYMEKGQVQTSQMVTLSQEPFTGNLNVFADGTYILSSWEGVQGYDLKFRLGNEDSLTVLNDNATEVVTAKGSRYWRVPTGRTDYDRACVYQNSSIYNILDIHAERANIVFGCSFLYPAGINTGVKAYYAVRGFNATSEKTVSMHECVWSDEQSAWVDTVNFNRTPIDKVKVYTLTDDNDSTYYCIPDFLGTLTGDILFGLYNGNTQNVSLLNMTSNGGFYYYLFDGDYNATEYDTVYPNYFYSSDANFAEGGSLIFDIWYQKAGETDGRYTYYCLNLEKETGIKALKGANASNGLNGKYIQNGRLVIKCGDRKYTTTGVEVK